MNRLIASGAAAVALVTVAVSTAVAQSAPPFVQLPSFPSTTAGFAMTAGALFAGQNAGRWILWDGNDVFIEDGIQTGQFDVVATGIAGDPSFLAAHPDGKRVLLGAGKCGTFGSGEMFLIDTDVDIDDPEFVSLPAPIDVTPTPINHFSGVWLDENKVLLDGCVTFGESELLIFDLEPFFSGAKADPVAKFVTMNKGAFSAALTTNASRTQVFAADGDTGETHMISSDALVAAFETDTPIDWTVESPDNVNLGNFPAGGPGAFTVLDTLVFNSFAPEVVFAFPPGYSQTDSLDPAGDGMNSYTVAYNPITGEVLAVGADFSTFPVTISGFVASTPLLSGAGAKTLTVTIGLLVSAGVLVFMGKRTQRDL